MIKNIFSLISAILFFSVCCMAQEQLAFPFQGGKDIMTRFFKDSLTVSPAIKQKKASGLAVFKFTADEKGGITKIIVYYADDAVLISPIVDALKKSNHKWIIPDREKSHDFIVPFSINFNLPVTATAELQKGIYNFYRNRKPIISNNQVPLDMATLLPTVLIKYEVTESR